MSTMTKIALSAAIVLSAASVALAKEKEEYSGGSQVQTWQEIQHANAATGAYHAYGFAAPNQKLGFVGSPKQNHRPSR